MTDKRGKKILLVMEEGLLGQGMVAVLKGRGYKAVAVESFRGILEEAYLEPPDLLLIDETSLKGEHREIITWLEAGKSRAPIPIIMIVAQGRMEEVERMRRPLVEDYLIKPFSQEELLLKVELCFRRGERQRERNPLTFLPGNLAIIEEIQRRLDADELFALGHLDLDDFKPYNDCYGFSRGDELLRMTARVVSNTVYEMAKEEGFVGHVGGDDFIFLCPPHLLDEICQQVIYRFDLILPTFYDEEDRARGFISSTDRRGNENRFPLITISIGVATNESRRFTHYGEMIEVANDLKNYAKRWPVSNYFKDKRAQ